MASALLAGEVDDGRVLRDAVVPKHDFAWSPANAKLRIDRFGVQVEEHLEERIRLFELQAVDLLGESLVDIECLLAGDRVCADDGVRVCNRQTLSYTAARFDRILVLFETRVLRRQTREEFTERGRESSEQLSRIRESRVTARWGCFEQEKNREAGRLSFVTYVRVEHGRNVAVQFFVVVELVLLRFVDQVKLRVALWLTRHLVLVKPRAEVAPELFQLLWRLVDERLLVVECDYSTLSHKESQLIELVRSELRQVNAAKSRSEAWGKLFG